MAGLPINYRTASPIIASYTFTNIIEGAGDVSFYIGTARDDAAASQDILRSSTFYSDSIERVQGGGNLTSSFVKKLDIDYDVTVATNQKILASTAICSLGWGVYGHASATISGYIIVKLKHGDSVIGEGRTDTIAKSGAAWELDATSLTLDLTETDLKIGDTLRITVEAWMKNSTGVYGGNLVWGEDPMNRDGGTLTPSTSDEPTRFIMSIPFKANI